MMDHDYISLLVLTPYAKLDPGTRLRILNHQDRLTGHGISVTIRSFADDRLFKLLYEGGLPRALPGLLAASVKRPFDIRDAKRFDAILIHREIMPFGPPILEKLAASLARRMILDIDDAIFMKTPHVTRFRAGIKGVGRVRELIRRADLIVAGSPVLVDSLRGLGARRVELLPTGIDLDRYRSEAPGAWLTQRQGPFCIGWMGTKDTSFYLRDLRDEICSLTGKYDIKVKLVGSCGVDFPGTTTERKPWSLDEEISDLKSFHVGLYPLADTQWEAAKSGYKALQYMAAGVPVVASDVGVLAELVRHEENGLLVRRPGDWRASVARILGDQELRERLIRNGLATVESGYSSLTIGDRLAKLIREICEGKSES